MRSSKYTQEFKDSTIQLVMNSDKSTYQIAQDLDINDKTLYSCQVQSKNVPICKAKMHHLIA
ncbi:MAG: transposase [Arcobacter sp.]|nr:transposase [Arcobacter sp.]